MGVYVDQLVLEDVEASGFFNGGLLISFAFSTWLFFDSSSGTKILFTTVSSLEMMTGVSLLFNLDRS